MREHLKTICDSKLSWALETNCKCVFAHIFCHFRSSGIFTTNTESYCINFCVPVIIGTTLILCSVFLITLLKILIFFYLPCNKINIMQNHYHLKSISCITFQQFDVFSAEQIMNHLNCKWKWYFTYLCFNPSFWFVYRPYFFEELNSRH